MSVLVAALLLAFPLAPAWRELAAADPQDTRRVLVSARLVDGNGRPLANIARVRCAFAGIGVSAALDREINSFMYQCGVVVRRDGGVELEVPRKYFAPSPDMPGVLVLVADLEPVGPDMPQEQRAGFLRLPVAGAEALDAGTIQLWGHPLRIAGSVVDDRGLPVAGAVVDAQSIYELESPWSAAPWDLDSVHWARTRTDGTFQIYAPSPHGNEERLLVQAVGLGGCGKGHAAAAFGDRDVRIVVDRSACGSCTGRLLLDPGIPAGTLAVSVDGARAAVGVDGSFELPQLGPGRRRPVLELAILGTVVSELPEIDVPRAGRITLADVHLRGQLVRLQAHVVRPDGAPLAGERLWADAERCRGSLRTDEHGDIDLSVPRSIGRLRLNVRDWQPFEVEDGGTVTVTAAPLGLRDDGPWIRPRPPIEPAPLLRPRLVWFHAIDESGFPVPGGELHMESPIRGGADEPVTFDAGVQYEVAERAQGRFAVRWPERFGCVDPGVLVVGCRGRDGIPRAGRLKLPAPDECPADLGWVVLEPEPLLVSGVVCDAQSQGLPNVHVEVVLPPRARWWYARPPPDATNPRWMLTDDEGRFAMHARLQGDSFELSCVGAPGCSQPLRSVSVGATGVRLLAGEGQCGRYEGRLLGDPGFRPWDVVVEFAAAGRRPFCARTDSQGRCYFEPILPGTYDVRVLTQTLRILVLEFPTVEVPVAAEIDDPRLKTIDLRGRLEEWDVTFEPPSGSKLDADRVYLRDGEGQERTWWLSGKGRLRGLVVPKGMAQIPFRIDGFEPGFLKGSGRVALVPR